MDCCSAKKSLLSLDNALDEMLSLVTAISDVETSPLAEACDRILSQSIISPIDVPSFDNSAMDGYAVRLSDISLNHALPVSGKSFAGQPVSSNIPKGQCVRIMTGAVIPANCEAVIMQEHTEEHAEGIIITNHGVKKGQNIRRIGEDIQKNSTILQPGTKLALAHLPLLASLGIANVEVYRRLKVAIFSTGDELRPVGSSLQQGQIYDTNRLAVKIMLQKLGCEVIDLGIIPDDEQQLRETFAMADRLANVVISSGGVSVGEADYTKQILDEQGTISFWKLAIKPGKPFAFGQLKQAWFCGLPGNPVSAVLTFYQLVQPLLIKLSGFSQWKPPVKFRARSQSALKKTPGRTDFQRGILSIDENGEYIVSSTGYQGSHIFSSFSLANCFIVLEQARGPVNSGEWVVVEPFNHLLGN